jgi:sugar lactone lactonase YvrE
MRSFRRALIALTLLAAAMPTAAHAWNRGSVQIFAALPAGSAHPEGITVDAQGNVYVTTFAVNHASGPGELFVFDRSGRLLRSLTVAGSSNLLLDLAFHPTSGKLLVIDFLGGSVLDVDPLTGVPSLFTQLPDIDPDPKVSPGPNVLTFDHDGNVYITDSFQGVVWRTGPAGGAPTQWLTHPSLKTSGVPPFGANGLAFNRNETALFVANTGNDQVLKVPVSGSPLVAGTPEVFANSVNGPDGLILDEDDNLWLAANQGDELVVLDPTGRTIAKLGDFGGITPDGAPRGLLFPASLARRGGVIYVTNLALDLRLVDPTFLTGSSQWTAEVTRHTIVKIRATLPRVLGLP